MKLSALTFLLLAAAAVADPPPERVFFSRVFPPHALARQRRASGLVPGRRTRMTNSSP
jgi:hypothetical protein